VPGVIWNSMRTPSIVSVWPVWSTSTVGVMRVGMPVEVVGPSPAPTAPSGPRGSAAPYM